MMRYRTTPDTQHGLWRGAVMRSSGNSVRTCQDNRPHIGPRAATILILAGRLAGRALRISANVHIAIVAAGAVDREFDRTDLFSSTPRLSRPRRSKRLRGAA